MWKDARMKRWVVLCLCAFGCRSPASTGSDAGTPPSASAPAFAPAPAPAASTATASSTSAAGVPPPSASAAARSEAIDGLVKRLSRSRLWSNGHFPKIELPEGTANEGVVAKVFQHVSFDRGPVKRHRTLETRGVQIGDHYTAVRVETEQGEMIVLLRYETRLSGWWSRVFPIHEDGGA